MLGTAQLSPKRLSDAMGDSVIAGDTRPQPDVTVVTRNKMSPAQRAKKATARQVFAPSRTEVRLHAIVLIVVIICATLLGLHKDLQGGDLLAIYTGAITGTAAVAGARSNSRQMRSSDEEDR
jgi:hypothetical protein